MQIELQGPGGRFKLEDILQKTNEQLTQTSFCSDNPKLRHKANYERGKLLYSMGNSHEALSAFEEAINLKPEDTESRMCRATILMNDSKPDSALDELSQILKYDSQDVEALMSRSAIYQQMEKHDEAIEDLQLALKQIPSFFFMADSKELAKNALQLTLCRIGLGCSYSEKGNHKQARRFLHKSLWNPLDIYEVLMFRGELANNLGEHTIALKDFEEAYTVKQDPDTWFYIGISQQSLNQNDSALWNLSRYAENSKDPERLFEAHKRIGEMSFRNMDFEKAESAYSQAIELLPGRENEQFANLYKDRALARYQIGAYDGAISDLSIARAYGLDEKLVKDTQDLFRSIKPSS